MRPALYVSGCQPDTCPLPCVATLLAPQDPFLPHLLQTLYPEPCSPALAPCSTPYYPCCCSLCNYTLPPCPGLSPQDPLLPQVLQTLRASGRQVFLATNSLWDYTNVVMNHLLLGKTGQAKTTEWLK